MIYTAIDTFYLTQEQLQNSPSRKDGIDEETETALRFYGCELIQEGGILLKLPQAVMATGQVLFQRFFCKKSFARFNVKRVAASCVWLAAKLEESPRKAQHVLNVFNRMECRREEKPIELLDPFSKRYEELKVDLIRTERHLLKEMGFICHVEHPHKFIINYLLQLQAPPDLMQEAWNLANDSLRTTLSVRFKSEVVACGVVYAAARRFKVSLPENPPWWKVFDAEKDDIEEVCRVLANLYRKPKASYIEVSKDAKSFVLTSRAWEPSASLKDSLGGSAVANGVKTTQVSSQNAESRESIVKIALDKLKSTVTQDSRRRLDEVRATSAANGDLSDEVQKGVEEQYETTPDRNKEVTGTEAKMKDKDRDRSKSRDKSREKDRHKDHEKLIDKDRGKIRDEYERDRDRKDREHRKDRSKESGYSEKSRHHTSSREKDYQSSYKLSREKDRHRHHPYT
ncbi:hypothetical protein KP509_33G050500 [Ceratopteris richardii]|uniref:Cyclin-L1-1 n=1 Tax=Ceratopteris richardii TaxID=49495 RepID=A0A8T2QPX8_CERRI|nr:hypothetical protein KP509_33G050500 [Ceratopteris richardii]KAH7285898.1 hypothetical protein KP509_33G050500 [Ceratopteris richardii]KAH7285902.1 hypothetical protein KP509_33G050500 [Ceratopteris richardii]